MSGDFDQAEAAETAAFKAQAAALIGKYFQCPFCGAEDLDAPGLKSHIKQGDCGVCENVETLRRVRFW